MKKILLLLAVALFTTATYAQNDFLKKEAWAKSFSAVTDAKDADANSPAAFDQEGNLYVTGKQTENFTFAGKDVEAISLGAYIAKYNANGDEQFAIALQGAIEITAITTDENNNLYVAGTYEGEAYITDIEGVEGEYETIGAEDQTGAFLAKYDANGNLLIVKTYQAVLPLEDYYDEMWGEWSSGINGIPYWGLNPTLAISKIVAEGSKVYAQFDYTGDVAVDAEMNLPAKYMLVDYMFYLEASNVAVVSFDNTLENPVNVAMVNVADEAAQASSVDSFNFDVNGENVYVAAYGMGDLVLTTAAGTETFNFAIDGGSERGVILANASVKAVKFSNAIFEGEAKFNVIAGMDVYKNNIRLAGTFNGTCAFDKNIEAVGASDVFVATVNAETLEVKDVATNAFDEGDTKKFNEAVKAVLFTTKKVYVVDAVVEMGKAPTAYKNYLLAADGTFTEVENALPATASAYNKKYAALINNAAETAVNVYSLYSVAATVNQTVVYDFTNNNWGIPTEEETSYTGIGDVAEYTDGVNTIKIDPSANNGKYYYASKNCLRVRGLNSKIVLPAFDFAVEKIEVTGHSDLVGSQASKDGVNIFVGGKAVSTERINLNNAHIFEIAPDKQAAGNVYEIAISTKGGNGPYMFITSIKVYPVKTENELNIEAPVFNYESGVYTSAIVVNPISQTEFFDGVEDVVYYYTTDGYEPDAECEMVEDGGITISESCTLKVIMECTYGGDCYTTESTAAEYIISESVTFEKAKSVFYGDFFIVANGQIAKPFEEGALPTIATTVSENNVTDAAYYAFSIEEAWDNTGAVVDGAYAIRDAKGNYLTFNSLSSNPKISTSTTRHQTGWEITIEEGLTKIRREGYVLVYRDNAIVAVKESEVTSNDVYPSLYTYPPLKLISCENDTDSTNDRLGTIKFKFENELSVNLPAEGLSIKDANGAVVATIKNSHCTISPANKTILRFNFPQQIIETPGTYTLVVPAAVIKSSDGKKVYYGDTFTFEVEGPGVPLCYTMPVSMEESGSALEELEKITFYFQYAKSIELHEIEAKIELTCGETKYEGTATKVDDKIEITFGQKFEENGSYSVVIPAGLFTMVGNRETITNEEMTLTYIVNKDAPLEVLEVIPATGKLDSIDQISIKFNKNVNATKDIIVLYDENNNEIQLGLISDENATDLSVVVYKPLKEFVDDAAVYEAITADGTYLFDLSQVVVAYKNNSQTGYCDGIYTWTIGESGNEGEGNEGEGNEGEGNEGESAIDDVEAEDAEDVIYDLTGRRINEITEAGIYIINGKKVLVK